MTTCAFCNEPAATDYRTLALCRACDDDPQRDQVFYLYAATLNAGAALALGELADTTWRAGLERAIRRAPDDLGVDRARQLSARFVRIALARFPGAEDSVRAVESLGVEPQMLNHFLPSDGERHG